MDGGGGGGDFDSGKFKWFFHGNKISSEISQHEEKLAKVKVSNRKNFSYCWRPTEPTDGARAGQQNASNPIETILSWCETESSWTIH